MNTFVHHVELAAPLFVLVLAGYLLMRGLRLAESDVREPLALRFLGRLPAMLFRLMSDLSQLPPVDARLLLAFFGGCLIVFVIGRLVAWRLFALDGVGQSVFALGGVFSNNVLLGLPLAKVALGDAALPSVALVLVFNALILWTLLTVSIEWAQARQLFAARLRQDGARRADQSDRRRHPFWHALFGLTGWPLPAFVALAAGDGRTGSGADGADCAGHGARRIRHSRRLADQRGDQRSEAGRAAAGGLAAGALIGLPAMETQVVVLLASLAVGANVYLMSRQFKHARRAGGEQPGPVDGAGGTDHAAGPDADRQLICRQRLSRRGGRRRWRAGTRCATAPSARIHR
jgi:malonate transporter